MIFKHKKLSESIVMRELEKVAVAKGMVKAPEAVVITKEASASYTPSNDLVQDIFKLANGLRERGFEKDASSLEDKVLSYKLAETHLYRAIDEDAEDMLEFAHPKKNKVVFEAANGEGEVEDTLSQHKKIIDIVNKQPKKVAFEVLAETANILGLKKNANQDEIDKKLTRINFYRNEANGLLNIQRSFYYVTRSAKSSDFSFLGDLGSVENGLFIGNVSKKVGFPLIEGNSVYAKDQFSVDFLNYFRESNNLEDGVIWKHFLSGDVDFNKLITDESVNHANKNLMDEYNKFINQLNSVPQIKKQDNGTISIDDVNAFIKSIHNLLNNKYFNFAFLGLTFNNFNGVGDKAKEYINGMIDTANELLKFVPNPVSSTIADALDPNLANMIAWRFSTVAEKDSDPNYFKQLSSVIKAYAGKSYKDLYDVLVKIDKDLSEATDAGKLDIIAQKWQKYHKIASSNNEFVKQAKTVPGDNIPATKPQATSPVSYTKNVSTNVKSNKPAEERSTFEQTFPDEFNAVSAMQNSLQLLADNLDKFSIVKPEDRIKVRNILLGTGGIQGTYNGRVDGIWGPKSESALKLANQILSSVDSKKQLTTDAQRVGGKIQNNLESKDVTALAQANVAIFNNVLNKVGVTVADSNTSKSTKLDPNSPYLDSLPANVNLLQTDPKENGDKVNGASVNIDDLSSFSKLLQFIKRDNLIGAVDINGFNYSTWNYILRWFYARANFQAKTANDPVKAKYLVLAKQLLEKFPSEFTDKEKVINANELDGKISGNVDKATGPTQQAFYKTNPGQTSDADGAETQNQVGKVELPPFGYEFNIMQLRKGKYGGSMDNFENYKDWLSIPIFNVNDFSYSPKQISAKYIKALTPQDILSLNGITNPLTIIPGQTNTKYTFLDLMNSNLPAAISLRARANDYALLSVINGLSRDLPAIMSAYVESSPSDKYNKIIANAWDKWATYLSTTRSRINSDFSQNGQIPKVIF